jgi:hypothetical protein
VTQDPDDLTGVHTEIDVEHDLLAPVPGLQVVDAEHHGA